MCLTLIPPVSVRDDEVSITLKTAPPIVPLTLNATNINLQPDLTLTPNSSSECLPPAPNKTIPSLPLASLFWRQYHFGLTSQILWCPSRVSVQFFFKIHNSTYSPGIRLNFTVQWCHGVIKPNLFHVQLHLSLITCDQGSLVVYAYFQYPSKPVGYDEYLNLITF